MASSLRLSGRTFLRYRDRVGNPSVIKYSSAAVNEVRKYPIKNLTNELRLVGTALSECDGGELTMKHRQHSVLVTPSKTVIDDFKDIKPGMSIAVEGRLAKKLAILERNGRFVYEGTEYIVANKIERLAKTEVRSLQKPTMEEDSVEQDEVDILAKPEARSTEESTEGKKYEQDQETETRRDM